MKRIKSLLALIVLLTVVGCTAKPDKNTGIPPAYNIVGEWEYTLTTPDGNVYDDGTMDFTGDASQGNWTQLNFYEIKYEGTYTVSGDTISLAGDENWKGQLVDETHMTGQWQNNESSGEWTAVKK